MRRRNVLAVLMVILAAVPVRAAAGPVPASAPPPSPEGVGCRTNAVTLAPVLKDDLTATGVPVESVPDADGTWTPVVLIAGQYGTAVHAADRSGVFSGVIDLDTDRPGYRPANPTSLIGALQAIPGAAVYTIEIPSTDQQPDGSQMAGNVQAAVDCLVAATGHQAVLIGHDTGGLANLYASREFGAGDKPTADKISTVINFGSTDQGGLIGEFGRSVESQMPVRSMMSLCLQYGEEAADATSTCSWLPRAVEMHDRRLGAMPFDSQALLQRYPPELDVLALTGQNTFVYPEMGMLESTIGVNPIDAGDLLVSEQAAVAQADRSLVVRCAYGAALDPGPADALGLSFFEWFSRAPSPPPTSADNGPCFHGNLARNVQLTDEAVRTVAAAIGRPPR